MMGTYVTWQLPIFCFISVFSLQFFTRLSLGSAVTAIISRRHVHSSRGTGIAHTVPHVLLLSLLLLAQGSAPHRALGAHIPLGGHWPRCSPDISHKQLREPGHGALKTQTVLAQSTTEIAR